MALDAADATQLDDERRLVAEAQQGNLDALRPLLERYAAPLYGAVIVPRLGDGAAAEDVLRDTFTTAIEKIGSFRWQGHSIFAWLRQIAVNKVFDVHRRTYRSQRLVEALAAEAPAATDRSEAADARLIAAEDERRNRGRIDETLAAIPERYAVAIRLRLIDELPRDACALKMNVTVGTFDVLLFRAVRAFRKRFGGRQ